MDTNITTPAYFAKLTAPQRVEVVLYILQSGRTVEIIREMYEAGTLELIFPPAIRGLHGMHQGRHHKYTALDHCAYCALASSENGDATDSLAALAHDWAKWETRNVKDDGTVTFYGHAERGAEMFRKWAAPLKEAFAAAGINTNLVAALIEHHMYFVAWVNNTPMRTNKILAMVDAIGEDSLYRLFRLRHADWITSAAEPETLEAMDRAQRDILLTAQERKNKAAADAKKIKLAVSARSSSA